MRGKNAEKEVVLLRVEDLEKEERIPHAVHVAVLKKMGWSPGRSVEQKVYQEAVEKFLKSPMGGAKSC